MTTPTRLSAYLRHVPPGSKLTAEQTARLLTALPLRASDVREAGVYLAVGKDGSSQTERVYVTPGGLTYLKSSGAYAFPDMFGKRWHWPVRGDE